MIKKKELRIDRINFKTEKILDSVSFVEENLPEKFEDFENSRILKNALYKEIEFAIENIISICNILNSDLRLGTPETEESIIEHLEMHKVLDKRIINLIRDMKRFRNILVHKYGEINDEQAFESIRGGLKDFELIINEIEKFLKKYS